MPAPIADDDLIALVHTPELIDAVKRAGDDPLGFEPAYGLGSDDNPVFHDMHRAAAHVVGATVEAFRQVGSGESLHSASICGGLHHAMPDRASGFCIYNDVAVGIRSLLASGVEKVAYVDVDVHHGDGVERIFYDDPRVLTDLAARDRPGAVPRHRLPRGLRRPRRARAPRSTSRSRPVRRTRAGCGPSTPSCRRWCASSPPTCWSPSTAATAIATTRSPT